MTRAAIYYRVSSRMQLEGRSLEQQLDDCRKLCERRGYIITAEYEERAESASTTRRPAFQRMMQDARDGQFDVVITHKLDRLSRSLVDVLLTMHDLQQRGVSYISASEDFDFTTPIGKIILAVIAALAEWYLSNLRSEIHKGKRARAAAGLSNNSIAPFGYTLQGKANESADHARRIFTAYAGGQSYIAIANDLNRAGCRTPRGNPFSPDAVCDIVQNPYYAGWVRERGLTDQITASGTRRRVPRSKARLHKGKHESLISQELFDECQAVRARKRNQYRDRAPKRVDAYLLHGIIHCSHCGRVMRAGSWPDGKYADYLCTSKRMGLPCDATRRQITEAALMPQLDALIAGITLPDNIRERALELANENPRDDARTRKDALSKEKNRLIRMYQRGDVSEAYYDVEMARIALDLSTTPKSVDVPQAITELASLAALWADATQVERTTILHTILARVDVDPDTRQITRVHPHPDYAGLI